MKQTARFHSFPVVQVRPAETGQRIYQVVYDFSYWTDIPPKGDLIRVEEGFPSDGASVPRLAWSFFPPSGQYTAAAILHDWLCDHQLFTSRIAHRIFLEAMEDLGVPWRVRWPMYLAVRLFGPRWG